MKLGVVGQMIGNPIVTPVVAVAAGAERGVLLLKVRPFFERAGSAMTACSSLAASATTARRPPGGFVDILLRRQTLRSREWAFRDRTPGRRRTAGWCGATWTPSHSARTNLGDHARRASDEVRPRLAHRRAACRGRMGRRAAHGVGYENSIMRPHVLVDEPPRRSRRSMSGTPSAWATGSRLSGTQAPGLDAGVAGCNAARTLEGRDRDGWAQRATANRGTLREGLHQRSAKALALGALIGVRITRILQMRRPHRRIGETWRLGRE